MLEQAHITFGAEIATLFWVYFLTINFGLLLFHVTGHALAVLLKINSHGVVKILSGYVFYCALAWYLRESDGSQIPYPAYFSLVLCLMGLMILSKVIRQRTAQAIPFDFRAIVRRAAPLFVIESVLILVWVGFLAGKPFHILVLGNNDIYAWGLLTDHLIGLADVNRINRGTGGSGLGHLLTDCFGVYAWLGLLSKISMKSHSIEAVMLFQLTVSILIAWLIHEIATTILGLTRIAAFAPAMVFSFNPLWLYVFSNNFLSQLVATFCFLCAIYIVGHSSSSRFNAKNQFLGGFLVYSSFLFSYPGLLPVYVIFVLGSAAVFKYVGCRAAGLGPGKETALALTGLAAGMAFAAFLFYGLNTYSLSRFSTLSVASAGWPLSMLDPLNVVGLVSYSLDRTIFANWTIYIILVTLAALMLLVRRLKSNNQSVNAANYDAILFISITALLGYMAVYYLKGDSYQQWKFATYFPLPVCVLAVWGLLAPKKND